jgi:hypothetical protein
MIIANADSQRDAAVLPLADRFINLPLTIQVGKPIPILELLHGTPFRTGSHSSSPWARVHFPTVLTSKGTSAAENIERAMASVIEVVALVSEIL